MPHGVNISLTGKAAIVTGGASGIGLACGVRLAQSGASVALFDIDADRGAAALQEVQSAVPQASVSFVHCDVTKAQDCKIATQQVLKTHGRIDVLFNNAGVIRRRSVVDLEEADWDLVLAVNLKAVYLLSREVIPAMQKSGGGSIINTGSGWSLVGGPNAAAYCAAKGGVLNLTRAMAIDHGPQGIRVNCVCPGDTDTPLLRSEARQLGLDETNFLADSANRPLNRLGDGRDIADAVLFLASDLSRWVTGTSLVVDGGGLAG